MTSDARRLKSRLKYVVAILAIIVAVGLGLYLGRGRIVAALLRAYLHRHSVEAALAVDRLDSGGLSGWVRLGKRAAPEFSVQRVELTFATPRFGSRHLIPQIDAIRLIRPQLRVGFDGQRLSFGSLQSIADALALRSGGGAPGVAVTIERATVRLSTPAGLFEIAADAAVRDGRLISLSATLQPAKLQAAGIAAAIASATITADMSAARLNATATVNFDWFSICGVNPVESRAAKARVNIKDAQFTFAGDRVSGVMRAMTDVNLSDLRLAGASAATVSAHGVLSNDAFAVAKTNWNLDGPIVMTIVGDRIRAETPGGDLYIQTARADLDGSTESGSSQTNGTLRGALTAVGGLADSRKIARAIPLLAEDARLMNAATATLHTARLVLPGLHIDWSREGVMLSSEEPGRILGSRGVQAILLRQSDRPLLRVQGGCLDGAFKLSLAGGGLPTLDLAVGSFRWSHNAVGQSKLEADADLKGRLDTPQLRGLTLSGGGHLVSARDALTFELKGCAAARAKAIMSAGHSLVSHFSGQLCPEYGQPVFTSRSSGLGINATWMLSSAAIDAVESTVTNANGRVLLKASLARLEVAHAELSDSRRVARFAPLTVTGDLVLAAGTYRGEFAIAEAAHARKIASIAIHHSTATDHGEAVIDASTLRFDPSGLQGTDLSPLIAPFVSRLTGDVSFNGRIAWAHGKVTSRGLLTGDGLDFSSPIGAVTHAALNVRFDSLVPPVIPTGQTFSAQRVDSVVPLEHLLARFSFASEALQLEGVDADAAEGWVSLDLLRFVPGLATESTIRLRGVDLGRIVADSGMANRVKLQARIDGVVPISLGPDGLRVRDGYIAAAGPGRLSIRRDVWAGAVATGGEAAAQTTALPVASELKPSTSAIQDFAYQALENLAFEQLDGTINSLPNGRLGLLFHIKGQNDPPIGLEARVAIVDLLRGRAFDKPLPLPKGTRIELTLETSINLDDLLAVYRGRNWPLSSGGAATRTRQNERASMENQR